MNIPEFDVSDDPSAIAAAMDEAGCVVLHNAQSEARIEGVKAQLAEHMRATFYSDSDDPEAFYPARTRRITGLVAKSTEVHDMLAHNSIMALCDHHLLPNCERYHVHVTAALEIGPGARAQVLHREEDPFTFFALPRPNLVIATMWAISDFRADNGATLLVPGSHRWPADRVAKDDEIKIAEMPKGSVLIWLGGTLHAAGANVSDDWRYGVIISYSLGWVRQEENQYLDVPMAIADKLPTKIRELIGYPMHGSLGFYEKDVGEELQLE